MARDIARTKVLILCGDYMEDYEVNVPFQALQAYGVFVDTVCPGKKADEFCRTALHQLADHQTYYESRGHDFSLNATFDEIEVSTYDGLIIQGGRAPEYLAMNQSVIDLVKQFANSRKPIAAVCHGGLVLAAAGLLRGRKCTGFQAVKHVLVHAGSRWVEPESIASCAVDENFITAVSYEGHPEYLRAFVKALGGTITGSTKRILFICGDFMEDLQVKVPFQSFQVIGCHVDAICPNKKAGDKCATVVHEFDGAQTYSERGGHDFFMTADYEGLDAWSYDALVIPGGRAPEYLAFDETVVKLVKQFVDQGKPVAAIGHGPQVLSAADVLKGKKCTGYPSLKLDLELAGATWLEPEPINRCVADGNLVTGGASASHPELISQLMALLGIKVTF